MKAKTSPTNFRIVKNADGSVSFAHNPTESSTSYFAAFTQNGNETVGFLNAFNDNAKFFAVKTEKGYALLSKTKHKFIRYDDAGGLSCDTTDLNLATKFDF